MKVLVIGANGNTGNRIIHRLSEGPHSPLAMIRSAKQREAFDAIGVPTVLGDLEYPIDHAMRGCDAVIFAAGSGSKTGKDKTVLIDHIGAIRSMVSAAVNGVSRYIMLSSVGSDSNSESRIRHYHRAKGSADEFLQQMHEVIPEPLDWTIVCPAGLTDDPASEKVEIDTDVTGNHQTSRENLAAALVACLDEPKTIGKRFELYDGNSPLRAALSALA